MNATQLNGEQALQNFFIVGAQKSGTTALHKYLGAHSEISLSKKELHFFDNDTYDWKRPNYDLLETQMHRKVGQLCGEATPIYMYWPKSIERLHAYDPTAKIIVSLRHPVYRAHSHWRMQTVRGKDTLPFSDAIRDGRRRVKDAENGCHRIYSYVERGFYSRQIKGLLKYYPRSQVHFLTSDHLWNEPEITLNAIENFLNIGQELKPKREYIISARTDIEDQISTTDFEYLMALFDTDIRETAKMTGLCLNDWFDDHYQEPVKNIFG
jgi:hypothetical protein